ncbi:unnamed protein product [Symbiodinium sp. CCMP2456]|nr:unnamed protein product [Symbiodinium sp. CCMP2456]
MELQTANVRRFMETTLQEQVQRNRTQNELGIRIYDEVELMVEKSAEEQALESRYIDTVLVTYCIPNSELKYNLSFRVDKDMKSKNLREGCHPAVGSVRACDEICAFQQAQVMVDWFPGLSQTKSLVQLIAGDVKGAERTQQNFIRQCPGVSQVTSAVQAIAGDTKGAAETQKQFGGAMSGLVDGIPVVGHIKGGIHYACGDSEGGERAMKGASRTVGAIGGGVGGFCVGGPVGAVAGGMAGGAAVDGITTGMDSAVKGEFRPSGVVESVKNMADGKADAGDIFDFGAGLAMDGAAGYAGGKLAQKATAGRAYRTMPEEVGKQAVKNGELPAGHNQGGPMGETWVSESAKHQKKYLAEKQAQHPELNMKTYQVETSAKALKKVKSEAVPQQGSKRLNRNLEAAGERPKNVTNAEQLGGHPKGKQNIGIKGQENLSDFNKTVRKIKEVDPNVLAERGPLRKAAGRFGKPAGMAAAAGAIEGRGDVDTAPFSYLAPNAVPRKNTSMMDRELTNILPKAGRKARRGGANKSSHDAGKGEGAAAGGSSGELAEQMMFLPGLFAFMTQRDRNVKQHLQRMKLRNIFIYLTVLVLAVYDIYLMQPPGVNYLCREGAVLPLTSGDVHTVDFEDIRTPSSVWAWLTDTVAAELFTADSLLRSGNYAVGFLQVLVQNVQPATAAQCPQEDTSFTLPPNVSCYAMAYTDDTAATASLAEVYTYFQGKIGLDGRSHQISPWQWGPSRMASPGGEASTQMTFSAVDGSGYSVEYSLQHPSAAQLSCMVTPSRSADTVRQAFLEDVAFLARASWLDTQTRAVHVQFTLYSPNYDLWIPSRYSFEMTGFGTVTPKIDVSTFRPGIIEYGSGFAQLLADIVRALFVLYICLFQVYWDFMYERRVNGAGWKHFFTIQGAVDLSIGSVFFAMFGLRYTTFNATASADLAGEELSFTSAVGALEESRLCIQYKVATISQATELAQTYNQHLALDAAMAALVLYRVLYFLKVNRHVFIIWTSVARAARIALRLLVVFAPILGALTVLSMGVSSNFDQYTRTFGSALTQNLLMIFGDDETIKAWARWCSL